MLTRRRVLQTMAASALATAPLPVRADEVIELDWGQLVPEGDSGTLMATLRGMGVVPHGAFVTGFDQEEARAVTTEFNGKTVRLPGFMVPLEYASTGVTAFILAPFLGACIHVPPPPANQLVLVTTDTPYEYDGIWDPIYVTGTFSTAVTATSLAEIGYEMSADKIELYD